MSFTYIVFDGMEEELGRVQSLNEIPEWEGALQRTAKQIARDNDGFIVDPETHVIAYDSADDDD